MYQADIKRCKTRKANYVVIGSIFVVIAIAIVVLLFVQAGKRERVVGKDITLESITEFYYTHSSSTYPPDYQRYRFYVEEGTYKFYHEKREGTDWPLTESHITGSGSIELSEKEWAEFLNLLKGGAVKKRNPSFEAGSSGPWLYLYWKGDRDKYQAFSFSTLNEMNAFEEFCEKLVTAYKE